MRLVFLLSLLFSWAFLSYAQQSEQAFLESYSTTGAQEFFYKSSRASYGGFLYIAGASLNSNGDYDMLLTKFSGSTEIWSVTWDGASGGDDYAASVTVDGTGNVIIGGATYINNGLNYDAVIVKYNSSGTLLWDETYSGSAGLADGFVSVAVDGQNSVYGCGGTVTSTEYTNFLTVKYNSSGTQQWVNTYDYNDLEDVAVKMAIVGSSMKVSGGSQYDSDEWEMSVVSYNLSTGSQINVGQIGGGTGSVDIVTDIARYGTDTYVVGARSGMNELDWLVAKLNDNLEIEWMVNYNGSDDLDDVANSVKADVSGNVYVTGYETLTSGGKNYVTRKYNSSGTLQWTETLDEGFDDEATSLEIDNSGNIIVTGSSYKNGNLDFLTIKYDDSDGSELWRHRFNSDNNMDDIPTNIAIEGNGDIYIVGSIEVNEGATTYMLCKYQTKDVYIPMPLNGYGSGGYFRNRGQLRNIGGTSNTTVEFYCQRSVPSTYLDSSKISFLFSSPFRDTLSMDTLHRVDMKFNKGSGNARLYPILERPEYINFYLGHMDFPSERTSSYNSIVKSGVYFNTDVVFSNDQHGFMNWIVAREGAPLGSIEMEYSGQDSIFVNSNGDLVIATSVGDYIQPKSQAFTMDNVTGELSQLNWQPDYFVSGGNKVSFNNIGSWNGTLVFQMNGSNVQGSQVTTNNELEWSTYFGGSSIDYLSDVVATPSGRCIVLGSTHSQEFPIGPGTQVLNEYVESRDAIVAAFDSESYLGWITYFGGSQDDRGLGITMSDLNDLIVVGFTQSSDLPDVADGNLDDSTLGGFTDGFIIRLSPSGFVTLDSYIGGDENDYITDVGFNQYGTTKDIYLVGSTLSSTSSFPLISPSGSYAQGYSGTEIGSNVGDGFIMRINELNNIPIWRTFFGSNSSDVCLEIAFAESDPYIIGKTRCNQYSSTECIEPLDGHFPYCISNGSWVNTNFGPNNSTKVFIVRFNKESNDLVWSTILCHAPTLLHPFSHQTIGIASQKTISDLYVTGHLGGEYISYHPFVNSSNSGSYNQTADIDQSAAFLMRIHPDGDLNDLVWSTAIDGIAYQSSSSVSISEDGAVYVSGFGSLEQIQDIADWCSTPSIDDDGFPICNSSGSNYMETNIDPVWWRSFISVFDGQDCIKWSTFFGNGHHNQISNSTVSGNYFYVCGASDYPETMEPSWTLFEYDAFSESDYFQNVHGGESDGTLARFNRSIITNLESEILGMNEFLIYPVPAEYHIQVIIPAYSSNDAEIVILDIRGRVVLSLPAQSGEMIIDIQHLSKGYYILKYQDSVGLVAKSFIKY